MALRIRRGLRASYSPSKLVEGEIAMTTDDNQFHFKGSQMNNVADNVYQKNDTLVAMSGQQIPAFGFITNAGKQIDLFVITPKLIPNLAISYTVYTATNSGIEIRTNGGTVVKSGSSDTSWWSNLSGVTATYTQITENCFRVRFESSTAFTMGGSAITSGAVVARFAGTFKFS